MATNPQMTINPPADGPNPTHIGAVVAPRDQQQAHHGVLGTPVHQSQHTPKLRAAIRQARDAAHPYNGGGQVMQRPRQHLTTPPLTEQQCYVLHTYAAVMDLLSRAKGRLAPKRRSCKCGCVACPCGCSGHFGSGKYGWYPPPGTNKQKELQAWDMHMKNILYLIPTSVQAPQQRFPRPQQPNQGVTLLQQPQQRFQQPRQRFQQPRQRLSPIQHLQQRFQQPQQPQQVIPPPQQPQEVLPQTQQGPEQPKYPSPKQSNLPTSHKIDKQQQEQLLQGQQRMQQQNEHQLQQKYSHTTPPSGFHEVQIQHVQSKRIHQASEDIYMKCNTPPQQHPEVPKTQQQQQVSHADSIKNQGSPSSGGTLRTPYKQPSTSVPDFKNIDEVTKFLEYKISQLS